jgi:hypothetical protein
MRAPRAFRHHAGMQVIAVGNPSSVGHRVAVARSLSVGVLLLLAGAALAWLSLGTQVVSGFMPYGRPSPLQVAGGIVVWGFAIVVPAAFLIMGVARVASVIEALAGQRPRKVTPHLASALGPDHIAATDLVLPGGRRLHELVLGPFGIVVLGAVPHSSFSRHVGSRWELRDDRGQWIAIEDPVQRASRDAERVRGWLATDDRDFLVRVYGVVVTEDERVERSPTCAVVTPRELSPWLAALPPQRGLTPARRERLVALIRSIAAR